MNRLVGKYFKIVASLSFGVVIFLFWYCLYPQALSYQEQYQLFLFTTDYFVKDISIAGGFADYVSEFFVQFYYVIWFGALLLALLFIVLQRLTWRVMRTEKEELYLVSFIPVLLLLIYMGDESMLLSFPVALIFSLLAVSAMSGRNVILDVFVIPVLYWLIGPAVWTYVLFRIIRCGWRSGWTALYLIASQIIAYALLLPQWSLKSVFCGLNYYRIPWAFVTPAWEVALILVFPMLAVVALLINKVKASCRMEITVSAVILLVLGSLVQSLGYDADKYELIMQDYLIRNERWNEVIERAQRKTVETAFWSNSVNLSLAMTGQLADRMFSFYQSGDDALIMPRIRDLTSNIPSAEAFYRLGMVNSAQRYAFDLQESISNGKKSGRFTKRIAECMIINGKYKVAAKQLGLLLNSLFYRKWAEYAESCLGHESKINADSEWGRIRQLRYKNDFLYNYDAKDKMFGILFSQNPKNVMALDYFMGQMLLDGNAHDFMTYLPWAQQTATGYMPVGYQDAISCIQAHGKADGSVYAKYMKRMMFENKNNK